MAWRGRRTRERKSERRPGGFSEESSGPCSLEKTQSTRTRTSSAWRARERKRLETAEQRARALTSAVLEKIRRRRASGSRSKGSDAIADGISSAEVDGLSSQSRSG